MDSDKPLLKIPIFKQSDDSLCGPASIKMVLSYYNENVEESQIAKLCNHTYDKGVDDYNMKKACEFLGYEVLIKNNSTFEDIQYWLNLNIPVIVDWFACFDNIINYDESPYSKNVPIEYSVPNGHSSIVIGLDNYYIYLLDPYYGAVRKLTLIDFERVWFDFRLEKINNFKEMIIRQIFIILPKKIK